MILNLKWVPVEKVTRFNKIHHFPTTALIDKKNKRSDLME